VDEGGAVELVWFLVAAGVVVLVGPWAWRRVRGPRLARDEVMVNSWRTLRRARRQARRLEDEGNYHGAHLVATVALAWAEPRCEQGTQRQRNRMRDARNELRLESERLRRYAERGRQ
jgi:hypothetical protein